MAAVNQLQRARKVIHGRSEPSSRSIILVHDDLGHVRGRHRRRLAGFLVGRGGWFVWSGSDLVIITFPVISLLEDEFLSVDQPALLNRPVVLLSVSLRGLLGRNFSFFLLLLPLGAIFRRLRVKGLFSLLFPLLELSLIGFLTWGEFQAAKRSTHTNTPSSTHLPSVSNVRIPSAC